MTKKNVLIVYILAVLIALVLWLTLFSRIGNYSRYFYPPFWSYRAILHGSGKALLENIGNIILFIPIGMTVAMFFRLSVKQSFLIGFGISLIIECCQWFFWLGSFEIDDLIHNTIGTGLGAVFIAYTAFGEKLKLENHKKSVIALFTMVVLIISFIFGYQGLRWQEMKRLAAMNDRADGTKNLLVLNPDPKYIGKTNFSVSYNSDGSVIIEGTTDKRAWIEIGKLTMGKGNYSFAGLSDINEKTIAIELEYYNTDQQKYMRLTPDVGAIEKTDFELAYHTRVRALVGLYEGAEGAFTVRPVIYRED